MIHALNMNIWTFWKMQWVLGHFLRLWLNRGQELIETMHEWVKHAPDTGTHVCNGLGPSQYPKRRLSVRSRKVSKPRDLSLELSDRYEIWLALRQQCCRCACQISKRYDNLKYQSRGFETLRDLTKRRLFGYWDGALVASHVWRLKQNIVKAVCTVDKC